MSEESLSTPLRASLGTLALLGLKDIRMDAPPTTLYFMLGERCLRNCSYCAQRKSSGGRYLSRVIWPEVSLEDVVGGLEIARERGARRICIQTLDYEGLMEDMERLLPPLTGRLPLSLSIPPLPEGDMRTLKAGGVETAAVSLDAATEVIFNRYRGRGVGNPYTWEGMWEAMRRSRKVFGSAVTHVIVGLGETDEELLRLFERLRSEGIYPALFAFTPLPSTPLEHLSPPPPGRYRAIQLMHHLIFHLRGEPGGVILRGGRVVGFKWKGVREVVQKGDYIRTTGCGGCNRPYYNESPRGPIYNYPAGPTLKQVRGALQQMKDYGVRIVES